MSWYDLKKYAIFSSHTMVRSHSKKKADHRNLRVARRAQFAKAYRDGWRFVSKKVCSHILPQETWEHVSATLSFRGSNISYFSIILKIMSFAFVEAILDSIDSGA